MDLKNAVFQQNAVPLPKKVPLFYRTAIIMSNATVNKDWQYLTNLYEVVKFFAIYTFPVAGLVGVVTNFINVYIFLFCWPTRTRQVIYLAFLAISDNCSLIALGWMYQFATHFFYKLGRLDIAYYPLQESELTCKLFRYFSTFSLMMACTAVLLTVADRTLSIYFPLKTSLWRPKSAIFACLLVTLICALLSLPYAILVGHTYYGTYKDCWLYPNIPGYNFLQILHFLIANVGIIQTAIILILNIALIARIAQAMRERKALVGKEATEDGKEKGVSKKEISASLLIVIISALYMACAFINVIGYSLAFVVKNYKGEFYRNLRDFGWTLGDLGFYLFFIQEAVNFFIYYTRMPEFQKIFLEKFCCCRR